MVATNEQFYLPFGKELAANEKKNRDKAVRALRKYITVAGGSLSETDLFKLWKGLFYCFWMSDKPLVQQALANDLGALILDMPEDNVIPFIEAFWKVHCAEWHGLDRIRLDKYLLLFRRVIFYSFSWLADNEWDEEKVEAYTTCLLEGPLHPTDRTKPDAIVYHIMEVYFEELEKVMDAVSNTKEEDDEELNVPMDALMRPIIVLSTDALNKTTRIKAKEVIREYEESDDDEDLDEALEAMDDDSDDMEEDSDDMEEDSE